MYVTLSEIREHLNLDNFFHEDDNFLMELIKVAEDATEKRIGKPLSKCIENDGDLTPSIKHTIKLLASSYYSQREATTPSTITKVPLCFDFLADLNKKYSNF